MKKEPFLTNFPLTVFATSKRKRQADIRIAKKRLLASSISGYSLLFNDVLPSDCKLPRQADSSKVEIFSIGERATGRQRGRDKMRANLNVFDGFDTI